MTAAYRLPADTTSAFHDQKVEGFTTPKADKTPQTAFFLPRKVMPIVFLPGVMGTNLKMTEKRRQELNKKDNIAWRPDNLGLGNISDEATKSTKERQLTLDPNATDVDVYDSRGPADISGDGRHSNLKLSGNLSPLLSDDPPNSKEKLTASQKARRRGWSELFVDSYKLLLERLETSVNAAFRNGQLQAGWKDVVGVEPASWGLSPAYRADNTPLTEAEVRQFVTGCFYPVHAIGYNWLKDNGESAKFVAQRIKKLIKEYQDKNFDCRKVILVTHSMGGLIARALVHPAYGNLQGSVAGVVHGVMPAMGSGAAYKRIVAGFEDPGLISMSPIVSLTSKVIGNYGDEVTCVMANSPGCLQLLPNGNYGNQWLRINHRNRQLEYWPKNGDPYEEIYKVTGKWYSLLREDWINPSKRREKDGGGSLQKTFLNLDIAKSFHEQVGTTFHPITYAHHANDPAHSSFDGVTWEISPQCVDPADWRNWPILQDNRLGVRTLKTIKAGDADFSYGMSFRTDSTVPITASLLPPTAPGDATVPARSADQSLGNPNVKAVFRQTGYDHQDSYKNDHVLAATLYSVVRIAMKDRKAVGTP